MADLNPTESIAVRFLNAWAARDINTIADLLDPDVEFRSPAHQLTGRDQVLPVIDEFAQLVEGIDVRVVTSAGSDVIVMYDMRTAAFGTLVAEHFVITNGRIAHDELVFDTAAMNTQP